MTVATLTVSLRTRLGVPSTDALFTDAVCLDLLAEANALFGIAHPWPWLEATATLDLTNAVNAYNIPADHRETVELQYADYPPLKRLDIADLRQLAGNGRPAFYAIYGEQVHIRPTPTTTEAAVDLTHLYIKVEPVLDDAADSPLLPTRYQWILVEYAAYLGFRRSGQLDKSTAAKGCVDSWVETWKGQQTRYSDDMGGGATPMPAAAPAAKP